MAAEPAEAVETTSIALFKKWVLLRGVARGGAHHCPSVHHCRPHATPRLDGLVFSHNGTGTRWMTSLR